MDTIIVVVVTGLVIGMAVMMIRYAGFVHPGPATGDRDKNGRGFGADHSSHNQNE